MSDKLVIFDYSGTLSLDAVEFSRSDNLIRHLQESGLFALGVDNTAIFWDIVNSTWAKGSTTRLGYKTVLEERLAELFPQKAAQNKEELSRSVSVFVDAYLNYSRIDGHWQSILNKLSLDKSATVIIATDHYAEATAAIINHLKKWSIKAVPLTSLVIPTPRIQRITRRRRGDDEAYCAYVEEADDAAGNVCQRMQGGEDNFIVANSADMGVYKSGQQFWQVVKDSLRQNFNRILLIDDFGVNEQPDDAYADSVKISERRQMTEKILHNIFAADVQSIFFAVGDKQIKSMIAEASAIIDEFLCESSNKENPAKFI